MNVATILITAVNALFPLIITLLLGYFLKRRGFLSKEFLKVGNKLVFNICLPAMLSVTVYDIASFADINWDIVL
jgi:predicted permease